MSAGKYPAGLDIRRLHLPPGRQLGCSCPNLPSCPPPPSFLIHQLLLTSNSLLLLRVSWIWTEDNEIVLPDTITVWARGPCTAPLPLNTSLYPSPFTVVTLTIYLFICGEPAISLHSHHVSLVQWTTCLLPITRDPGTSPLGGYLCETGILLLAMSRYISLSLMIFKITTSYLPI
jgi:hypothetical protein